MKTNDITIASFPKAGVSYLGWLLTAARADLSGLDIRPTFFNIDWLLIDDGQMKDRVRTDIWRDGMGDFVKTHADRPPGRHNTIYVLRNPYDTLKSYYHFLQQWHGKAPGTPRQFLDSPDGINKWVRHLASWTGGQKPSEPMHIVQYENLVANPTQQIASIFFTLGFPLAYQTAAFDKAVAWASLEHMRLMEQHFAAANPGYQKFNMEFTRKGEKREVAGFGPDLQAYVESRTSAAYEAVKSKLP